ncbi:MAG: ferrous iron transport protein B [Planctomycetota bacterium]|nr:ferrous iron transport protein B [Planctomycetota bacterium]
MSGAASEATGGVSAPPAATGVKRVAIIGNPNTGKTTLFNALTGMSARVGNYPGVTVEKKTGALEPGVELIDLPGTYSLAAHSPDEMVAVNVLHGDQAGEARPHAVVVIVDAGNLQRNLFLLTQVMEVGLPIVVALNMVDAAAKAGVTVDPKALGEALGLPVVPTVASEKKGLDALRAAIRATLKDAPAPKPAWNWPPSLKQEIDALAKGQGIDAFLAGRALIDEGGAAETMLAARRGAAAREALQAARAKVRAAGSPPAKLEIQMRYAWIARAVGPCVSRQPAGPGLTDRLDRVLTHRLVGTLAFVLLMTGVFVTIFIVADPIMGLIDECFGWVGDQITASFAGGAMEGGMLQSLLVDGVVAGVGGVLVFLPQIAFLFLFIALLEDCGYMARAAFLMDRVLRFCGLSGHSFIPLMSSFACAVPGVMATRTIGNPRDRFTTILIAPLMSCSARIPVYAMLSRAFVPADGLHGFLPALVFAGMYFVGIVAAIPVALVLKGTLLKGPTPPFVMELPQYKMPTPRVVWQRVWEASKAFTVRAGTAIFAISIVIWALLYFPHQASIGEDYEARREAVRAAYGDEEKLAEEAKAERQSKLDELDHQEAGAYLRASIMGRMGHWIEPVVRPLGWDWKIGMAAIASFPAREVIVGTLRIIYDLGDEGDDEETAQKQIQDKLQAAEWPDGRKVYNLPVALSIMIFFALCAQCAATLVTIKKEMGSWKWAAFTFVYMTTLAYIGAFATYQIGMMLL